MPVFTVVCSDEEYAKLQDDYEKMSAAWPRSGRKAPPPSFEQWLGTRAAGSDKAPISEAELDHVRVFHAIEKLVTSLGSHDFGLAHMAKSSVSPTKSSFELASLLVADLNLPETYLHRIQSLFEHYLKSAREVADTAQVGVTNRTYGALWEAYRTLADRSGKNAEQLGEDRAIGRVEGSIAMLVTLNILDRHAAEQRSDAFKLQVRTAKSSWVGKVFGGTGKKE